MAKGYIKPTFGFEPIDNEPFLKDVTFATVAEASAHAKTGVSSYPGKILTVATGSSTTIYQVNPDKSIEAIPTVSMIAANTAAANASLSSLQTQITSIENYIDVLDSSHISYVNTQVENLRTYVNTQDTSILNAAKADSKSKADTALASAKSYTDGSVNTLRNYVNTQDTSILNAAKADSKSKADSALASAKSYTDSSLSILKEYIDGQIEILTNSIKSINASLGRVIFY